jgi:multidrug efflux system membrane fusion protein
MSAMRPISRIIKQLAGALSATALLAACLPETLSSGAGTEDSGAPEIQVAAPLVETIPASLEFPAMIEAMDRVTLHAQVSGYLDSIEFEEGAFVRENDVLFRIDARTYAARLADAEAALLIARAEHNVARNEAQRAEQLRQRNALSTEEIERRIAHAEVTEARVLAAEAEVAAARLDVEFAVIRAPFAGRIGRARVTRGNLVTPADELGVLVAVDELLVRFDVDEQAYADLVPQDRDAWYVHFAAGGLETTGPVTIIESEVKPGTGTVRMFAQIPNPGRRLLPGMFGEARLVYGELEDAVLIDDKAVGTNQGQRYVLVVNESNVLEYRPVTIGAEFGDLRAVESGLTPADRLVVNGLMRVRPGAVVTPVEVPMSMVAGATLPSRAVAGSF